MTIKQLKVLISTGVFSAALLAGTAYAEDAKKGAETPTVEKSTSTVKPKKNAKAKKKEVAPEVKEAAQQGCGGAHGCGGK